MEKYSIIHSSYAKTSIHIINPAHNERDYKYQVKFLCVENGVVVNEMQKRNIILRKAKKKKLSMCVFG